MTTFVRDQILAAMGREELANLVRLIHGEMYNPPDKEWSPDTLQHIAWFFEQYGLEPT
jgi:hypothetical protein